MYETRKALEYFMIFYIWLIILAVTVPLTVFLIKGTIEIVKDILNGNIFNS